MKPEAQRIAIAEACGWRKHMDRDVCHHWTSPNHGKLQFDFVPDYLNDLNAIHEAEKSLSNDDWDDKYYHWLGYVISGHQETQLWQYRKMVVHATATQRAEAFLRTIGEWKDDDK